MNFSDKLKKLRNEKNITQTELADAIYISRSMIAKYENGLVYPTKETAEKIAVYFNVKLSDLIDKDENVQISLDTLKSIKLIHKIISIIGIIICSSFLIISLIPILHGFNYVYPIQPDMDHPLKEYYTWSIIYSCTKNGNPIAIITFVICVLNISLFVLRFFIKNSKVKYYFFVSAIVLLIINLFLIIVSIIFACAYAL